MEAMGEGVNRAYRNSQSALRSVWTFERTGAQVLEGALRQLGFRQQRLRFWIGKRDEVMAEIRASGIEVNETITEELEKMANASSANYAGTIRSMAMGGRHGPQVTIKPELLERLGECHDKIHGHRAAVEQYIGWAQVLRDNPEAKMQLTADDWLYFFRTAA